MTPEERASQLAYTHAMRTAIATAIRDAERAAFRRGLERAASEAETLGWGLSPTGVARRIRAIEEEG